MDFWPEFLPSSWGRAFVAGGIRGITGIILGYPLDTLRIRQQSLALVLGFAVAMLWKIIRDEGPGTLYGGMGATLASVTFQNAMVFQIYATLSREFDTSDSTQGPPSYKGALWAESASATEPSQRSHKRCEDDITTRGRPWNVPRPYDNHAKGCSLARGLLLDVRVTREQLHPNCRANGNENLRTMLVSGGSAGVASWIFCYPLDVVKTRLQAQSEISEIKYKGIVNCFWKSIRDDGCWGAVARVGNRGSPSICSERSHIFCL